MLGEKRMMFFKPNVERLAERTSKLASLSCLTLAADGKYLAYALETYLTLSTACRG
jgi:hypothetical protein